MKSAVFNGYMPQHVQHEHACNFGIHKSQNSSVVKQDEPAKAKLHTVK